LEVKERVIGVRLMKEAYVKKRVKTDGANFLEAKESNTS
jgi:hypothetical protein